ncbi:MAG: hypothetical protein ABH877_04455, partial [bacterium]
MRSPAPARSDKLRLLPLFLAALLLAVLAGPTAALAAETPSSTASTAPAVGATTPLPSATDTSAAPTDATTSTAGPGAPAGAPGLVPPVEGFSPLNPGWKTDQMQVQVWPEYDQKAVLVFLNFSLSPDVQLPATLKLAIPKGAVIAGIGEIDPNGTFTYNYADSYPPVDSGPVWDIATIEVRDYRSLQIDYYYDPGLPQGAGARSFPLLLQLPVDVGTLLLHVQQPARSTDFKLQPDPEGVGTSNDGFTYAVTTFTDAQAGSTLGQVISYSKTDGGLSIDSGESAPTKIATSTVLLAAILVVVVLVGGLVVYRLYTTSGRDKTSKARSGTRPGPTSRPTPPARKKQAAGAKGAGTER